MPAVTSSSPAIRFQYSGSPRNSTAPSADRPGTSAVIMVERTGPKYWIIRVKVMPEITTEPTPWNSIWKANLAQGAVPRWLVTQPSAASSA